MAYADYTDSADSGEEGFVLEKMRVRFPVAEGEHKGPSEDVLLQQQAEHFQLALSRVQFMTVGRVGLVYEAMERVKQHLRDHPAEVCTFTKGVHVRDAIMAKYDTCLAEQGWPSAMTVTKKERDQLEESLTNTVYCTDAWVEMF